MSIIQISSHGPLVLSTNYWSSEIEREGKVFVSPNAGAIRCLLPRNLRPVIGELRAAKYAILSRGPWPEAGLAEAVEILWEDHTDSPHAWHLSPESFALLPAEPAAGEEWTISVWDVKKGKPHKAIERVCQWRRVGKLPWMKAWSAP